MFAVILCIVIVVGMFIVFQFLKYLYGNNYKNWKPLLFSKGDTFESIFGTGVKKDYKDKNKQQADIHK